MSHDNNNRAEFVYIFSTNENKCRIVFTAIARQFSTNVVNRQYIEKSDELRCMSPYTLNRLMYTKWDASRFVSHKCPIIRAAAPSCRVTAALLCRTLPVRTTGDQPLIAFFAIIRCAPSQSNPASSSRRVPCAVTPWCNNRRSRRTAAGGAPGTWIAGAGCAWYKMTSRVHQKRPLLFLRKFVVFCPAQTFAFVTSHRFPLTSGSIVPPFAGQVLAATRRALRYIILVI